jgi:hypothetical protein
MVKSWIVQGLSHQFDPPLCAFVIHQLHGIVVVMEIKAKFASMIARAYAHDVNPHRRLCVDVMTKTADSLKY